jgi:hypothetical protein
MLHSTIKGQLVDVTKLVNLVEVTDGTGPASWSLTPNADGQVLDVRLVSVASNSGKRCNYTYSDLALGGTGLTTTNGSRDTSDKTVTVCAVSDKDLVSPPITPPEPISTVGNGCDASFTYKTDPTSDLTTSQFGIAIGYSKAFDGDFEGAAVCSASGKPQNQCINECVPLPEGECTQNDDGSYPLSCAQCKWEDPNSALKFCWYYENRVCKSTYAAGESIPTYCGDRAYTDSFVPSPKKKSLSAQIDVTTGSNCYTVTVGPMYGGRTYSYQVCE